MVGNRNLTVDLMLTGKCNEACPFCYGARKPNASENGVPIYQNHRLEMSTEQWKTIIDSLYTIGVRSFNIGGGEPTLRRDLVEILKHIKSKEEPALVYISTNALILSLDTELRQTLYGLVDVFGLSFDGANTESNVQMGRVERHYEANRELIRQISIEMPEKAVKIGTVVSSVNENGIADIGAEIQKWWAETPFNLVIWRLFQFSPVEEGYDNRHIYEIGEATFNNIAAQIGSRFTDINVVGRPHSVAENAYFLVLPTGELALVQDGKHQSITEPLISLTSESLINIIEQHTDTISRVEENRRWLPTEVIL